MALSNIEINGAAAATDYAGRAPIVVSGDCSRYPYDGGVLFGETLAVSDHGGKLTLSKLVLDPNWEVGDTIQLSGFEDDAAQYNGRHIIDNIATPEIRTATDYNGGVAETGTVTRLNENLLVRVKLDGFGEVDTRVIDGKFSVDVSRLIKFESIFSLTAGELDCSGFVKDIDVTFDEVFQGADYLPKVVADGGTLDFLAHNTTDISNLATTKSNHHQTILRAKDYIIWHEIADDAEFLFELYKNGVIAVDVSVTITNKHGGYVYKVPADAKVITVKSTSPIKETLTYIVPTTCTNKRLYWLNRLGGYSIMEVHRYEKITDVEKIKEYPTESHELIRLFGIEEPETKGEYYKDLIDSPEIRNESGEQVWLVDTNLAYRTERVAPVVTIKTENKWLR